MVNDFRTIITADNKPFIESIKKAERSFKNFRDGIGDQGGFKAFQSNIASAAGSITKLAGGLGVAVGSFEVFNKAINSNAKLQDSYRAAMETGKTVTDQFFSAIYSGDWKVFDQGISGAIDRAREYVGEMRNLQRVFEVLRSRYDDIEADKTKLESIIEDESRPLAERQEAYGQIETLLTSSIENTSKKLEIAADKLQKSIEGRIGETGYINAGNAKDILLDLRDPTSGLTKELEEYARAKKAATVGVNWDVFGKTGDEAYEETQKAARRFYSTYTKEEREKNDELLRLQGALGDTMYEQWQQIIDEISAFQERIGTWRKDLSGARDEITGATGNPGTGAPGEGSIAYLDSRISDLSKKLKDATDEATRQGIREAIKGLEDERIKINMEALGEGSLDYLNAQISELTKRLNAETDEAARQGIRTAIENINKEKHKIELEATLGRLEAITPTGLPTADISGINISELNKQLQAYKDSLPENGIRLIDTDNSQIQSLNSMASLLGSINTLTGEGASGWLSYASAVMQSIAQMIPQLSALATKNAAVAATGAASSVASIPVVGWIMAAGAVASVIAAMTNIPKFANGGIVPGNMFSGDRVPVMANSGEMILNRTQQGNLFRLLNEGGSPRNEVEVSGNFVVRGSDLVLAIKNYERKLARAR